MKKLFSRDKQFWRLAARRAGAVPLYGTDVHFVRSQRTTVPAENYLGDKINRLLMKNNYRGVT